MGLDQFAYAKKGEEKIEIAYWRKHANLHGWMEDRYRMGGGKEQFNCVELPLGSDDLNVLEENYKNLALAEGFFWGVSQLEDNDSTIAFIQKARDYIKDGYEIVYDSWW